MGARRRASWIHSTIFFTLLSYQVLIPGCILPGLSSASPSLTVSVPASPLSRQSGIVLVRDSSSSSSSLEEDAVLPHNLIPRFNIPPGNLSTTRRLPFWEALYFLKNGVIPPTNSKNHDPYNYTELEKIQAFHDVVRDSPHNRRSDQLNTVSSVESDIEDEREVKIHRQSEITMMVSPDEMENIYDNEIGTGGTKHANYYPMEEDEGLRNIVEMGLGLGLHGMQQENFPDEAELEEMMSNSILPPQPRPISSLRHFRQAFPFPLHQIRRFGFSRRPRAGSNLGRKAKIKGADNGGNFGTIRTEMTSGRESGRDRGGDVLYIWPRSTTTNHQKQYKNLENPTISTSSVKTDPRKHYNYKDPFDLLRKFLMEQDSTSENQKAKQQNKHQPQFGKISTTASGGIGNVFLKNLVKSRSGGGSGSGSGFPGGGNDEESLNDGDTGPRGDGRKFQTQGW